MLWLVKSIQDYSIWATDGDIGKLGQLYIDVTRWAIHFLVVATGTWLPGRKVLVPMLAVNDFDHWGVFHLDLTQAQIRHCPPVDPGRPISRGAEREYIHHYGVPLDWCKANVAHGVAPPIQSTIEEQCEPYLVSTKELDGFHLHAAEGDIGHLADFVIDVEAWTVPYLLVDTGHWLPDRTVLVPTARLHEVNLNKKLIRTDLTRDQLRHAPDVDLAAPLTEETRLQLDHYYQPQTGRSLV